MIYTARTYAKAVRLAQSHADEGQRTMLVYFSSAGRFFVFPAYGFPPRDRVIHTATPQIVPCEIASGPPYAGDVAAAFAQVQGEIEAATKRLKGEESEKA